MPDSVLAQLGRCTAAELRGKPVARGVYASERLSLVAIGKTSRNSHGRQPDSRDATVRDDTGGLRRRELWERLNGHGKRKRRNSQAVP
jgi:hypothetical protein